MEDRLAQFLKLEELTAVKFAEIMEVQPSSISHLLSGRNKPNFEFVSRMLLRFPNLNPDWIINGIGDIYKGESPKALPLVTDVNAPVVTNVNSIQVTDVTSNDSDSSILNSQYSTTLDTQNDDTNDAYINILGGQGVVEPDVTDVNAGDSPSNQTSPINRPKEVVKIISRVILFYSDGSFEEYSN